MKTTIPFAIAASLCLGGMSSASAQYLEDIEVRQEGNNAVLHIKFVTPVQYSKSIASRSGDLVQAFYNVLPTRDQIAEVTSERRLNGGGGIPSVIITDEPSISTSQATSSRKLLIRFGAPVRTRIRAGKGNQGIEVVLEGLGSSARFVTVQARLPSNAGVSATAPATGFVVTLQSASTPGVPLSASVPASLQNYQVFTSSRVMEGKTIYDTNLGYFQSRSDAQRALGLVAQRFPGAVLGSTQANTPTTNSSTVQAHLNDAPVAEAGSRAGDVDPSANALLAAAQAAFDGGNYVGAIDVLNQLLNLPPNGSSRRAQELAGLARLNSGDTKGATGEFELFLKLYPEGDDSNRVRQLVGAMPSLSVNQVQAKPAAQAAATTSGSISTFYYGGKSDVRTQEFKDSVLGSLPILQSDTTLSATDQKQLQTNIDLNWRYRDSDKDLRLVFRDAYSADLLPKGVGKERLSALYFDYRSLTNGTSFRVGRQSPNGGGVLYRFDGLLAGYTFKPKWKLNAVIGTPTDALLDTRRTFYGVSLDAEALTKEIAASVFLIQQVIDGEVDRRGFGADLRYFRGGFSASAQFDYDQILKAVNIAAVQATWQISDSTVVNAMADRRTTPMLSLGNVLFFQDPSLAAPARRIQELLGTTPIETLREQVKGLTAYQTQARIGGTTAISANWQTGADLSITSVDEIQPVAILLPNGQPSTGSLWAVGSQLIGSNLYSARDTHVFNVSFLGGPTYRGTLLSYNNLSSLSDKWQLEPSAKYYRQNDTAGATNSTWTMGVRAVYRVRQQISLESEITLERSEATAASLNGPGSVTSSARMSYYIGGRFDF